MPRFSCLNAGFTAPATIALSQAMWGLPQPGLAHDANATALAITAKSTAVTTLRDLQAALKLQTKQLCDELDIADDELLGVATKDADKLKLAARRAAEAEIACIAAKKTLGETELDLKVARSQLRLAGLGVDDKVDPVAKPPMTAASAAAIVSAAAGAQKKVVDLREKAAGAYATADGAVKKALETKDASEQDLMAQVSQAQVAARAAVGAQQSRSEAQSAANKLVQKALAVKLLCPSEDRCMPEQVPDSAQQALNDFNASVADAQATNQRLRLASLGVDVVNKYKDPKDRERAIKFALLLDERADARKLAGGGDAVRLSASSEGTKATLKLAFDRSGPADIRDLSLILETPITDGGTSLVSRKNKGFSDGSSAELGYTAFKNTLGNLGTSQIFFASGGSLKLAQNRFAFTRPGAFGSESKETHYPWAASLYSALAPVPLADSEVSKDLHSFKLSLGRGYSAPDAVITCPAPLASNEISVTCKSGVTNGPKAASTRELAYSYRTELADRPVEFAFVRDLKAHTTKFEMPIYLIKSSKDSDKGAFNAGISLGWSKADKFNFGVFIGAPFSLYAIDR